MRIPLPPYPGSSVITNKESNLATKELPEEEAVPDPGSSVITDKELNLATKELPEEEAVLNKATKKPKKMKRSEFE